MQAPVSLAAEQSLPFDYGRFAERFRGPEEYVKSGQRFYIPYFSGSKDVLVGPGHGGRLVALGDGIILRIGGGGLVASPGDIVIWSGLVILSAEASIRWQVAQRRARIERARRIAHAQEELSGAQEPMTAEGDAATQR